ncbi:MULTISPECIES: hypothetical protein [Listeria]|uniref:hypothetical protein n=1 Tax=Listeria TaxID=1637 RepID=UPI000B5887E3|nr:MULTISPECIES: hypothetical protein [Listeria]
MEEQNQITYSTKTPQNKWKIATIIISVCSIIVIAILSYMLVTTNTGNDMNGTMQQQNGGPGNFGQQNGTSQEGMTPPDANSGATQDGGSSDSGNSSDSSDSSTF